MLSRLKAIYAKYEKLWVPGLVLLGVILDFISFRTLQITTTLTLLAIYATAAAICILYTHIYDGRIPQPTSRVLAWLRLGAPPVVQFTFGALLSMSLVFYWYSGSIAASWPILVAAVVLMASNEVLRHFLMKPIPQMSLFSFVLFSLFIIAIPYLTHSVSDWTFYLGGAMSLVISLLLARMLIRFAPQIHARRKRLVFAILVVFGTMNVAYVTNVIPPIPLSIREAGVYHNVERVNGDYILTGETESFWDRLIPGVTIHRAPNERVYVYTSIFAPGELKTQIFHRWQYYDTTRSEWITTDRLSFPITGGRDSGYRGYSYKSRLAEGKWRVVVETARGQVLGNVGFAMKLND